MAAKSTWMSGGSGSGVYDPVTTGDTLGVQYSDQDEGWLRFKGRKYNFGTYRNSGLKGLCDEIRSRSRPKCVFIGFIATVLLVLLIAVIVVASSRDTQPNPRFQKWTNKSVGVNFRPAGQHGTVFLPFSLQSGKENSYLDYTLQLEDALDSYKTKHIFNDGHVVCNKTYAPADKVCQQPISVFGRNCVNSKRYGYPEGQPCVLLTLSLPKDYTVRGLLPKDGKAYTDAEKALGSRFSPLTVGVSCEPATAEDTKYVGNTSAFGNATTYNPPDGFPAYFFRQRTEEKFVAPAVMVQFLSIRDSVKEAHMVRMVCTAWGKAMDRQSNVINDDALFTATFIFRIH